MGAETHQFHPTVLREYDIRGVVGETLSASDARAIGRAFGTIVRRQGGARVAVGYDGRLSSPEMEEALAGGLNSVGIDVERIGRGPTPMLYFATFSGGLDGGIMVTGSHNPPDYNGFKMMLGKKPFFGDDIQQVGRMASAGDAEAGEGASRTVDVSDTYLDALVGAYDAEAGIKVVWDPGNGASGEVLQRLVERLPGSHSIINGAIDGTFPAHHPDPTVPEYLVQLQEQVRADSAEIGIAFDGDGDRIGVIDGEGEILWADQLLILLARDVLRENPGATIIADVKASQLLFDSVAEAGGQPLMFKTGHSLIKSKMAETGSPLAGEMSGHIFYADRYFGFDDALYVAVRALAVLARTGQTLADFRKSLPALVNTPELRFTCAEDRKFVVPGEVKARLDARGADVDATDGVRVNSEDGWWLLRASNTQDVLVARCESDSEAGLQRLKKELVVELERSNVEIPADL